MKLAVCLSAYFGSKMKLADGFMVWRGIKLWNRQSRSGKKMKLTARGRGEFFKNCTRALRALVQFSKNSPLPRPSVSFFSRPTLDGFIILAPSKHETAASFIFEPKKQTTKPPVSFSFTWNCAFRWFHAKNATFLAPSFSETMAVFWVSAQFQ